MELANFSSKTLFLLMADHLKVRQPAKRIKTYDKSRHIIATLTHQQSDTG